MCTILCSWQAAIFDNILSMGRMKKRRFESLGLCFEGVCQGFETGLELQYVYTRCTIKVQVERGRNFAASAVCNNAHKKGGGGGWLNYY